MKSKINFIEGKTGKCLVQMVGPLLLSMILMMAYNMVDSLWVGNLLGEAGYAALTTSTAVILILNAIAMGAGNGVSILISQIVGAGKKEEVGGATATIFAVSGVFSILVTTLLEFFLPLILKVLQTPEEIYGQAYEYLEIYLLGYAAIYLYMQFTAVFRSFGDPVFQVKGMFVSTILNAIINPVLISFWGIKGAAYATVLAEILCLGFAIVYYKKKVFFSIVWKEMSCKYLKEFVRAAIPSAIQQCMPAISTAAMTILVSRFGVTTLTAYGVCGKLETFLFYPAMAVNMALTSIVGQCMGAERKDRVKSYMKCAIIYGAMAMAVLSVGIIVFSGELSHMFVQNSEVSQTVKEFFHIVSIGYVLYFITSCYLGKLSGEGKPGMSMLLLIFYYVIVRIPLAYCLVESSIGLNGIWIAILVSHIVAAILALVIGNKNRILSRTFT